MHVVRIGQVVQTFAATRREQVVGDVGEHFLAAGFEKTVHLAAVGTGVDHAVPRGRRASFEVRVAFADRGRERRPVGPVQRRRADEHRARIDQVGEQRGALAEEVSGTLVAAVAAQVLEPGPADRVALDRAGRAGLQIVPLRQAQIIPLEGYALGAVVGQDDARIGNEVTAVEFVGGSPLRARRQFASIEIDDLEGEQVALPAVGVELRQVDHRLGGQLGRVDRYRRRGRGTLRDVVDRGAERILQRYRVVGGQELAAGVVGGVPHVVDLLGVAEVRVGPLEADRQRVVDFRVERADRAERNRVGHEVLVRGLVDAGLGRHAIVEVGSQVGFIVIHRNVGERIPFVVGIVAAVVRLRLVAVEDGVAGAAVRIRVADGRIAAVPETVADQDVEVLLAFAAVGRAQDRRVRAAIGEVLAHVIEAAAHRRALAPDIVVVERGQQVTLVGRIAHRRDRRELPVVELVHAHARGLGIVDRGADDRLGRVHPRAVVLEPVGEVLHFRGRIGRDDDPLVFVGNVDDAVAIGVGPDVVGRDPEIIDSDRATEGIIRFRRSQIVGSGQVDPFAARNERVLERPGRIGIGVQRRAVGLGAGPGYVGQARIVIIQVRIMVADHPGIGPFRGVAGEGEDRVGVVGRRHDVATPVETRKLRRVIGELAPVDERQALVGGQPAGVFAEHRVPVHAARIVDGKVNVGLDDGRQEQRRGRQWTGRCPGRLHGGQAQQCAGGDYRESPGKFITSHGTHPDK